MMTPGNQQPPKGASAPKPGRSIPIDGGEDTKKTSSPDTNTPDEAEAEEIAAEAEIEEAAEEAVEADLIEEAEAIVENADLDESEVVAQAKAEAADWRDKYMRLHAEWDTYRRRTKEQRAEEKVRAAEKLVEGLIPVLDDFQRTIEYAQNNGETGLLGGVEAVHNKLISVLEKDGVVVIDPEGEAYDALEAQAVGTVDDPSVPDETVAQVYQKGYRLGAKVLRPAMVTVTVGGPKRETPEEE